MINQVEKKNPKRRFKEFLGKENWNVHTLGTVLMSMYNGQTPSRSKGEYWNGKINWLTSGELNCGIVNDTFEKITELGLDSAKLKIIPKGILVIAITGLEASGTRGNCAILGCNTTLNQSCMALFPIRSLISSDFLFYWYLFIGDYYGIKYTQGTKQQSYNAKILNDLEILIPSLDEQNKISSFFSKLDSMIDFQKRKLDKLEATKKALLQEIFPEEGQDKPKRRFKGFTGAWEQRKLSDILKVNSGKDYKHLDQGNIPVYGTGGYMLSVNESLSNIDAIGIGRKGTIDKPQYLKAPFWTVDTLFYLTALDKHSILFLYYLMQLIPWKKFDESTGVPSLSKTTIDNISGFVPSNFQEEELISVLFNQLDKSITLHQRKLDKLKNLKQAYLNEMFV